MKERQPSACLLFMAFFASFILVSCHSAKKATKSSAGNNKFKVKSETKPVTYQNTEQYAGTPERKKKKEKNNPPAESPKRESGVVSKYASLLDVSKKDITNTTLYNFIDVWYGTPYKYAGRTKSGVDCSDFASLLEQSVYNITIAGACGDIYKKCKPVKASELREGDLVFFKINSKSLSHVGVYLQNHKFVHASVHAGVVISDLGEDYYRKFYWGGGEAEKIEMNYE